MGVSPFCCLCFSSFYHIKGGLSMYCVVFWGRLRDCFENIEKTSKNFEKSIDKRWRVWYNIRVANEYVMKSPVHSMKCCDRETKSRKFQKLLKKCLTNGIECDIIYRLSTRGSDENSKRSADDPWKLNNNQNCTKHEDEWSSSESRQFLFNSDFKIAL